MRQLAVTLACALFASVVVVPQSSEPSSAPALQKSALSFPASGKNGPGSVDSSPSQSDAESITRLVRSIEADETRLDEMVTELESPKSEFAQAEQAFKELDEQLKAKQAQLDEAKNSNDDTAKIGELTETVSELTTRWTLAKDRFELAIKERRLLQEKIATLEEKVEQDRAALDRLKGNSPPAKIKAEPVARESESAAAPIPAAKPQNGESTATAPNVPGLTPPTMSTNADSTTPAAAEKSSLVVTEARKEALAKQVEAKKAQDEAESIQQRIETLERDIANDQQLLDTARLKTSNALNDRNQLNADIEKKRSEAAPAAAIQPLLEQRNDADRRLDEARIAATEMSDRLTERQSELVALQSQQLEAMRQAEKKVEEADAAQKKVVQLENPFAPHNMAKWLITRGPKLLGIFLTILLLLWLANVAERRMVNWVVNGGRSRTPADENRVRTLIGVMHNAASVVIVIAGGIMILDESGVNVGLVMGGAAIVGLAVAFGAQNLVRDYFYGFVILLENQYALGDVVRIGDITGQVERITLRMTVLRSLDGTVHFLPNGENTKVSNLTHNWSRALFDIGVAYKEDIDRVIEVLTQLARELREDPGYAPLILDDPEMLGVNELGDSSVVVRFYLKTMPLAQFAVKREMLRRVKNRFDELGIEIPFPHRTVYHRNDPALEMPADRAWSMSSQFDR